MVGIVSTEQGTPVIGPDRTDARHLAMTQALNLHHSGWADLIATDGTEDADAALRATAAIIYDWYVGPVAIYVTIGTVVNQTTGQPTGTVLKGTPMQLHDDENVDLSVIVASAKGALIADDPSSTGDDLTWEVDDSTVASLAVSDDTRTCTVRSGVVGSTVLTIGVGNASATLAVDVVPGDAALITVSEGTPYKQ
jgi:hypothetical protein